MDEIPPELRARRQSLYDTITRTGRARRRRRFATAVVVVSIVIAIPVAAVAMTSHGGGSNVLSILPATTSTSVPDSTTVTTIETPSTTVDTPTSSAPSVPSSEPPPTEPTTTPVTGLTCHNSENPACGPVDYEPPITNAAAHLTIVSVSPAAPKVGENVTITLRATDPDSRIDQSSVWCNEGGYTFGDGESTRCIADCATARFGPWDPPAPHPSDLVIRMNHKYATVGSYEAKFTASGDVCGPRPSSASASVVITVSS